MMKVITLWQPWATWVALGWKTIETRTHNRFACLEGKTIAIHAGKKFDDKAMLIASDYLKNKGLQAEANVVLYPKGLILCTAFVREFGFINNLAHCIDALIECHNGGEGRYGLYLENITELKYPIKTKGSQGIWNFEIKE